MFGRRRLAERVRALEARHEVTLLHLKVLDADLRHHKHALSPDTTKTQEAELPSRNVRGR